MTNLEKKILATSEVEPDDFELEVISKIEKADDTSEGISLNKMRALRKEQDKQARVSVKMSRGMRKNLIEEAKSKGVSLNQYILHRLSR